MGKVEKLTRQNRVRDALGKIYDQYPPYFREYLRRFKEDPTSRVFAPLAEAYRRLGRVEEAIEVVLQGLEHHPDFHGGRVTLAKCYLDLKKFADARTALERVVQFAPENLLAQRLLGDVFVALGERNRALHAYKMALLLSPNDVNLSEKVRLLERGEMATVAENNSQANETENLESGDRPEDFFRDDSSAPGTVSAAPMATPPTDTVGSEPGSIDSLLGFSGDEEESFKTEHVSKVFTSDNRRGKQEITTETLGDLYLSQGQYDRALRIFDKLADKSPSRDLVRKINQCRLHLGVDKTAMVRSRQIDVLRGLLTKVRNN